MTESPEQQPAVPGRLRRLRPTSLRPTWWPLPACVLLGAACGFSYGMLAQPEYAATSYAMVTAGKGIDPAAALGYAQSYGRLATSDATLSYAKGAAGEPVRELRAHVRSETSPDSPMIAVTGTSVSRGRAADIANAVTEAVVVSSGHVAKDTGVKLVKFSHAVPPVDPVSPSAPLGTAVGASAGGLVGGLILLVRPRSGRRGVTAQVPGPTHGGTTGERELVR
ncbi:lipopolysaccharide biosynthesis protein [Streptomyces sp. NE06-03E]|uniref:Lipopolysaccharide biosynthesis protein n=2 Tax=Streptomyces TaxID=1883 RepID=A0A652L8J6_9ACTN|nr:MULTISPECIES: lipopolysaccharide biosynthesis protein [unclassified Streptomyces]WSS67071.1 lipopolysaccharide biosynthesis protein [Streptomyces sp. NBC_01175]MDX3054816.1 lipopolysaccharide biosynthesis protein [Streptomyces sp. NE06-03E]MDX3324341.1 lipopolysaccharide biosynthesis protein [Streptomyces sp. ME02-6979-3A]MDX3428294.1 lipopolysaccharide biosynthesis protein [Streptomyces sp. ME01-18a]MDX3684560.1 lipopolysaccharide biosynthesis protein [Streptomyces sp. AK04-4c]